MGKSTACNAPPVHVYTLYNVEINKFRLFCTLYGKYGLFCPLNYIKLSPLYFENLENLCRLISSIKQPYIDPFKLELTFTEFQTEKIYM